MALQNNEKQMKVALHEKLSEQQELLKIVDLLKSGKEEQEGEALGACAWLMLLRLLLAGFELLLLALRAGVVWCRLFWTVITD